MKTIHTIKTEAVERWKNRGKYLSTHKDIEAFWLHELELAVRAGEEIGKEEQRMSNEIQNSKIQ